MALGYILGKASSRYLKTNPNIPLVMTLAIIPDADILAQSVPSLVVILPHRGPLHSVFTALIVFIPFFVVYRKAMIPYFIALLQHSLIGDFLTGGKLQLLWPISQQQYGINASIQSPQNIALEWIFFLASMVILYKAKDIFVLFQHHRSNLILFIPTVTVLLPTFFAQPLDVPIWLIPPHIVYTVLFLAVILVELFRLPVLPDSGSQITFESRVDVLGRGRRPGS